MAIRQWELESSSAVVYRFPTAAVRSRARAQRRAARLRRTAAIAVTLVASVLFLAASGPGGTALSKPHAPKAVVVRPGQTLWDLAQRYAAPGIDPRAYVDAVIELNGLDGGAQAGQRLVLPGI